MQIQYLYNTSKSKTVKFLTSCKHQHYYSNKHNNIKFKFNILGNIKSIFNKLFNINSRFNKLVNIKVKFNILANFLSKV